jgi:copper chaperone
MTEVKLSIPDIHCQHCKMAIEGAVHAVPGVRRVETDVAGRSVVVAFDDPATLEQIVAAIEDQGYLVPDRP